MEKYVSIGKAAKMLGVSISSLRLWEKRGLLVPERTPTGHRRYDADKLKTFDRKTVVSSERPVFIYARVSTQKQADAGNLDRQIGRLVSYAMSRGYNVNKVYKDIASGLNENRKSLQKMLKEIKDSEGALILIEYKDRLARFGYVYLEQYIRSFGGEIITVEEKEVNEQQELVEDLIAITTSFSAKIYDKRGGRVAKKLTKSIEEELNADENDN